MINKISSTDFFEQTIGLSKVEEAGQPSSFAFKDILTDAIEQTELLQQQADADSLALSLGDVDNLATVQINSLKAQSMLQTTVQLTTRTVNAYKEIMQMQV